MSGIIHYLQDVFDVGVDVADRKGLKDYVRPRRSGTPSMRFERERWALTPS